MAEFVAETTLTAQQLDFLQVLTNHVIETARSRRRRFSMRPTARSLLQSDVLFGDDKIVELCGILHSIKDRARVS